MVGGNSLSLEGRVVLITGGSRGIGKAVALAMAQAGADVMVNFVSDEGAARETADKIRALGREGADIQSRCCGCRGSEIDGR